MKKNIYNNANVHGQFYANVKSLNTRFQLPLMKTVRSANERRSVLDTTISMILVTILKIIIQVTTTTTTTTIIIIIIMQMHVVDDYLQIQWTSYQNRQLLYVFTTSTAVFERPTFHVRIHVSLQSYLLSFIEEIPWCLIIYNVNKLFIVAVKHNNKSIFSDWFPLF
jgi:hypothetical protein